MNWNMENRGKFEICGEWLKKKVVRNFGGWKSEILGGKGQIGEIFRGVRKIFSEIWGGKSEIGGNASLPQRGWTPLSLWPKCALIRKRYPSDGSRTKWYGQNGIRTKWHWTKWYGQNVTDKILWIKSSINPASIDNMIFSSIAHPLWRLQLSSMCLSFICDFRLLNVYWIQLN